MKLSVLICSLPSRVNEFNILHELNSQIKEFKNDVEIIYLGDCWNWSIGEKRNKLISLACGDYICFVDDDDMISDNYINLILKAINKKTDVITFEVKIRHLNEWKKVFYNKDFLRDKNFPKYFERLPNHLMVFKKEIYEKVKFRNLNMGEDSIFAREVKPLLKTQTKIKDTLYYYHADREKSESIKRHNRQ